MKYRIRDETMADGSHRITVRYIEQAHGILMHWNTVTDNLGEPCFDPNEGKGHFLFASINHAKHEIDRHKQMTKSTTVVEVNEIDYP